jgi:hypothetical protein
MERKSRLVIDSQAVDTLRARVPGCEFVDRIAELDAVAGALPYEVFREPVAVNEIDDSGNTRLLNLNAEYLTGWSRHMAYSMRVRLRALEPGIVNELAAGRALGAQVLLRSHLESAAMAALCLETLKDGDLKALSKLVPQTLFGTALFTRAKRDERVADMLTYSEQRTIAISHALAALHKFTRPGGGPDDTGFVYSLLCEASHPNHRGTKLFVHIEDVDSSGEYGWHVTYSATESVPELITEKLVETLVFSMSAGYGATELLRNMHISDSDTGPIAHGVPAEIGKKIWFDILQKSVSSKPRSTRSSRARKRKRRT